MPFTTSFARESVASIKRAINSFENIYYVCDDVLRPKTKTKLWSNSKNVYCHISYDAKRSFDRNEDLIRKVAILKDQAEKNFDKYVNPDEHLKYLDMRRSSKSELGYTISYKEDVIKKAIKYSGYMVLIT
ncbi:MAG: hypothetical protein LBF12_04145 [Christensenellaceae bacterium]|nr:hypothetical protein [Christensenellaceae bacterium]